MHFSNTYYHIMQYVIHDFMNYSDLISACDQLFVGQLKGGSAQMQCPHIPHYSDH